MVKMPAIGGGGIARSGRYGPGMRDALRLLAQALDPGQAPEAAAGALDALRGRWPQLDAEERAALTPVARLAAERLEARRAAPEPPADPEEEAYLAALAAMEGSAPAEEPEPSEPGGVVALPPPRAPRAPVDVEPEALLAEFGLTAFRPGQREAVAAALAARDSLVVMPTGGGKSLCYQLPGIASPDLTVIVSPLIALMEDQCRRLTELGHPAVMLASGRENRAALDAIRDGGAQIVFAAPERFASGAFRAALARRTIALFVVDEAHCVSEWGHDFRPDYLRLRPVIDALGHPPVMACTATATPKVAEEIVARLGLRDPERVRSGFDRPNLSFDVIPFDGEGSVARKRALLSDGLAMEDNRPAIVYCGTRKSTEEVAEELGRSGLRTVAYHAGMTPAARSESQRAFMAGEAEVVVATNAFGMGVDKADVRSVWHWALPSSLEAYYQEAGRAGRDGAPSRAVLLASRSDLGRLVRFIREAEVTPAQIRSLVDRLSAAASDGVLELDAPSDRDRIALGVAERAGALRLAPGHDGRMRIELSVRGLDVGAAARLCREATNRRWESYRSIERYASTSDVCRRRQMLDHFGDDSPGAPLGRCCDVDDPPDWLPATRSVRAGGGSGRRQATPAEEGRDVSEDELAPLKQWRRERADGKPAYTIANDATLREIVRRAPSTPAELATIRGIGPAFIDRHSESLLELLAR
jgi:ATP-dependent DNA helicase RecQ